MSDDMSDILKAVREANEGALACIEALDACVQRVAEQREEVARMKRMFRDATSFEAAAAASLEQTKELERLRAVLRQTHEVYCDEAWTSRGMHAPQCLACEVGP